MAIVTKLQKNYLSSLPNASIQVETVGLKLNITSNDSVAAQHNVLKKRSGEQLLYVDVDLLPQSLSARDVEAIKNVSPHHLTPAHVYVAFPLPQISQKIQDDALRGALNFTVDNVTIAATVELTTPVVIVETEQANKMLYIELGAGLGAGLLLVIAIAVVLAVVVFCYRRYSCKVGNLVRHN